MSKMSIEALTVSATCAATWQPAWLARPFVRAALSGPAMGTRWSASFFTTDTAGLARVRAALVTAVDEVDAQMSNWKPDSDLSRFNRAPVGRWLPLPVRLGQVIEAGLGISELSNNAFEMAVGQAVDAWGFGPSGPKDLGVPPETSGPAHACDAIEIDRQAHRWRKTAPVQLDLCGIAKGYGVDRLAEVLLAHELDRFLVGIDGEMRAGAAKPDGAPWTVAVERPDRTTRSADRVLQMRQSGVATSGDYRHFSEANGRSVSHTIDPATGVPLDNGVAAVSVLANTCMLADAWATALMVMGATRGPAFAREAGLPALFTVRDADELREMEVGPNWRVQG